MTAATFTDEQELVIELIVELVRAGRGQEVREIFNGND